MCGGIIMENRSDVGKHTVTVTEKEKTLVTGVEKVLSVKVDCLALSTTMGTLAFNGKNFTVNGYNEKDMTFSFSGEISSMVYQGRKEPLFKKLFK